MAVRQPVERDYEAEMGAFLDQSIPKADYVAPILAEKLVRQLRSKNPTLLSGYLNLRAVSIVTELIGLRDRHERRQNRNRMTRNAIESGSFSVVLTVDANNTRRRVADMTGADFRFVANGYSRDSKVAAMYAAFYRAVAKRIDGRRCADVMTEQQYDTLYRSITGE